ncbi:DUF3017 domain-containing protein [Streptomyces sp. NBC_01335]|uniref:DUF3017 domain-containing protein n=1 Tax=Streptomyces sp. NBC_01335 TaxID=2903828 RepID=UPI002E1491D1|nr:DUF3017 domain-containing protein [Streptomyces sp. NBC_01335]
MAAATSPADPARSDAGGGEPAGDPTGKPAAEASPEPAAEPSAGSSVEPSAEPSAGSSVEPSAEPSAGSADEPAAGTAPQDASTAPQDASAEAPQRSWRFSLTRDTARPEGGGRAASGDAPAPARQWPLLTVLVTAALGLLLVATDPFAEAFRIGSLLIGVALLIGAVLRWVVPSVGMLAVRSRFTDLVTYGVMGTLIVLLALMAQPKPWLDIPVLEDAVHFTIR